jgi:hypothetical protein
MHPPGTPHRPQLLSQTICMSEGGREVNQPTPNSPRKKNPHATSILPAPQSSFREGGGREPLTGPEMPSLRGGDRDPGLGGKDIRLLRVGEVQVDPELRKRDGMGPPARNPRPRRCCCREF